MAATPPLKRLDLNGTRAYIASILTTEQIQNRTFRLTYEAGFGLLFDKIGLTFTIEQEFPDEYTWMMGRDLPAGEILEEWGAALPKLVDWDKEGSTTLAPHYPQFLPPNYSYPEKTIQIATMISHAQWKRSFQTAEELADAMTNILAKLYKSRAINLVAQKRELMGLAASQAHAAMTTATAFAVSTAYAAGTYLKNPSGDERGVVIEDITADNTSTWATLVSQGNIKVLTLEETITAPTDTETGEAFVARLQAVIESLGHATEGNSLNGNVLGRQGRLKLIVKDGILPILRTYVRAGTFQLGEIEIPADIETTPDFGTKAPANLVALLIDPRGLKLFRGFEEASSQYNAQGLFTNYYLTSRYTPMLSRNVLIHNFVTA